MNALKTLAPWLLLLALTGVASADDCQRLVQPVAPLTCGRGTRQVQFVPPTTSGSWYVVVSRDGPSPGRVELNGQVVVTPEQLAGPTNRYVRVPVTVLASDTLRVVVTGTTQLVVSVVGVVPAAQVPASAGPRVGRVTLFQQALFAAGAQPRRTPVALPASDGLFDLHLRAGPLRPLTAALLWNGEAVLGVLPIVPSRATADGPVRVQATNQLETLVLGLPASSVSVTLDGWLIDEVAPTAA